MAVNPNVEKSLFQMPQGLPSLQGEEPQTIEIEIENPDDVRVNGESVMEEQQEEDFYRNLAEGMDEAKLQSIARDLLDDIKEDLRARDDWEKMQKEGVNLLGLKYEIRTEPWQGACGVFHPMITEAVIRFQSDTMMETFPASGPVRTKIVGKVTKDKEEAAGRVEDDMNWQLMDNMPEFRREHERLMFNLPASGCGFKKVYKCPILQRPTSVFVPAEDIVIPYGTTDLITCERIAHRMRKSKLDIKRMQESGFWRDVDIPDPPIIQPSEVQQKKDKEVGVQSLMDQRHTIYEVIVDLNIDNGDSKPGLTSPYVVTVMDLQFITLSIRRNWKEDDETQQKRLHFVQYDYIPGYGAYGFGLFHTLGGFAQSATSITRQLVDAGTLSNLPGGLKSKGLRIKGEDTPVSPGEFRDVDVGSGTIRDNILPLPYKEPSATLFELLKNIVEEGRRYAATNDIKVADMSAQAPVGTTLAVLERQLRTLTAVQARVHYSFKLELRLLAELFKEDAEDTSPEYAYDVDAPDGSKARLADYSYVSIIPVSDPNAATMSQRVVQYQAAIQLAQMSPEIYDQEELHRQMLATLGIKNIDKLIPTEDDIKVVDPVQENQNILKCKPVKAHAWQDHESHIRVHMAAMQDPLVQQLVGQNPKANQIMGAMTAHIAEHVGFAYRNKMAQAMNMDLPVLQDDEELPEQVELQLSRIMAQAAPFVLQQSQQIVAQQQAQKNAQDPVLVAQMMEQQNAKAEIERKKWKDQQDVALEQQKLQIDAKAKGVDPQRMQAELQLEQVKAAGKQQIEQQKVQGQQVREAQKLQFDQAKQAEQHRQQMSAQRQQQAMQAEQHRFEAAKQIDRHQQEMRLAREKHEADLKAKKETTAAQVAAARAQAKAKPKPSGDKK